MALAPANFCRASLDSTTDILLSVSLLLVGLNKKKKFKPFWHGKRWHGKKGSLCPIRSVPATAKPPISSAPTWFDVMTSFNKELEDDKTLSCIKNRFSRAHHPVSKRTIRQASLSSHWLSTRVALIPNVAFHLNKLKSISLNPTFQQRGSQNS